MKGQSATDNLLLVCTRYVLGTATSEDVSVVIEQGIGWERLVELIQYHRLESLLHDNKSGSMVELHWELAIPDSSFPINFQAAWCERNRTLLSTE